MSALRAKVRNGRLIVDEPTALPDGTEVRLMLADDDDDLDENDRAELHAALERAWESVRAGRTAPASELLQRLASEE